MKQYSTPTMIPMGSLHEMTLDAYPPGTVHKAGGDADVITFAVGLGGPFTISS